MVVDVTLLLVSVDNLLWEIHIFYSKLQD